MFDIFLRNVKETITDPFVSLIKSFTFSPNYLTSIGGIFGLLCTYSSFKGDAYLSFTFWVLNRFFDGIDGPYARATGQASDFGGYYDIIIDFTAYCLIPIGICANQRNELVYIVCLYMMGTFVINSVSLFFLSAVLEKNDTAKKNYKHKEMTTLKMPPALIEGFETMVFYGVFVLFPDYCII